MERSLTFIDRDDKRNLLIISLVFIITSTILYGYYFLFTDYKLQLVYQNWDGPSYVVIAKSFYNTSLIKLHNTTGIPEDYFAAHFPLYPIFIRLFSFIGYFRSMIFVSQLFSLLFIFVMYFVGKELYSKINPLIPALSLILFTPRWFTVSHVGSSEPVFLFFVGLFIYFLIKGNLKWSAVCVSIATLARAQGILIFIGITLYATWLVINKKIKPSKAIREYAIFLLTPIALLAVFLLQYIEYDNIFAFWDALKGYNHLQLPLFKVFSNFNNKGTHDFWKEMIVFNFMIYLSSVIELFRQRKMDLFFVAIVLFLPLPFLVHLDISRYALYLLPFLYVALYKLLSNKTFAITIYVLLPAIIIYSVNFMNLNLAP